MGIVVPTDRFAGVNAPINARCIDGNPFLARWSALTLQDIICYSLDWEAEVDMRGESYHILCRSITTRRFNACR